MEAFDYDLVTVTVLCLAVSRAMPGHGMNPSVPRHLESYDDN